MLALVVATLALTDTVEIREGFVMRDVSAGGRIPFPTDRIAQQLAEGTWRAPTSEGDGWVAARAGEDGAFAATALPGGAALVSSFEAKTAGVMILEAAGHSLAYVNGEPRGGDVYGYGYVKLPMRVKEGRNEIVLYGGRGAVRARLTPPPGDAFFNLGDPTLPDLVAGQATSEGWLSTPILNATASPMRDLEAETTVGTTSRVTALPPLPALSSVKAPLSFAAPALPAGEHDLKLTLRRRGGATLAEGSLKIRSLTPGRARKVTFKSEIDGSVQYYAVLDATKPSSANAFVLTLHGASVEAIGQAEAYGAKEDITIVAPTNRRPFGFDWEDWGRMDAMEVLAHAQARIPHDPRRVGLTGHSMGGHGTWQLGVTFPDRWTAIGPSAGWESFQSYVGQVLPDPATPMGELFARTASPSQTRLRERNLLSFTTYILHGDADDNVPVREARTMRDVLTQLGAKFEYHEQPGAGHWWDGDRAAGADCVDWPPMFELFRKLRTPSLLELEAIDFTTVNPRISARYGWASIEQQTKPLAKSSITLRLDRERRHVSGATENVAALELHLADAFAALPREISMEIDGQRLDEIPVRGDRPVSLRRSQNRWRLSVPAKQREKHAGSGGPFKEAWSQRAILVVGTNGSSAENAWAEAKARYDAEVWWYRGNGFVEVIADREFTPERVRGRNVVLYGHRTMNAAWSRLLGETPVTIDRGVAIVGTRRLERNDLGLLMVYRRADEPDRQVLVVAGTGPAGMRSVERLPYFAAGVHYPDWTLTSSSALRTGLAGVVAAGYFGNDWSLGQGETVWASPPGQ